MVKFKSMVIVLLLVFLLIPIAFSMSEIGCDMEDAMGEAWGLQDIAGFNDILADWWEHC